MAPRAAERRPSVRVRDRITRADVEGELGRLGAVLDSLRVLDAERGPRLLENVRAYESDARHFMDERGDLVLAFEAAVWAWAWVEIGCELGVLASDDARLKKF